METPAGPTPTEEPLDPDLSICDPHHHLWDTPQSRYLLDELVADARGHRVVKTVFVECMSKYREDGAEAFKPVGETDFVEDIASRSASGNDGEIRVGAGIVGFADLTRGSAVDEARQWNRSTSRTGSR